MADSLWVVGASMTKFMRYKADAGLTIFDTDILAAGCLFDTSVSGSASRSRSARPESPYTTWPTPARPARPRSGWSPWPSRPARPASGWPSASSRWVSAACSVPHRRSRATEPTSRPAATLIDGAKAGLTRVIGLGSACAMHILEKAAA